MPMGIYIRKPATKRFVEKIFKQKNNKCWLWVGTKLCSGYGVIRNNNRSIGAHRFSWQTHRGKIPDGLWVLHKCDNRACVNPEHLFLGTHQDNMDDMVKKGRQVSGASIHPEIVRGSRNPRAKLTEPIVLEIRRRHVAERLGKLKLSKIYGVGRTTIQHLLNRDTWTHV